MLQLATQVFLDLNWREIIRSALHYGDPLVYANEDILDFLEVKIDLTEGLPVVPLIRVRRNW